MTGEAWCIEVRWVLTVTVWFLLHLYWWKLTWKLQLFSVWCTPFHQYGLWNRSDGVQISVWFLLPMRMQKVQLHSSVRKIREGALLGDLELGLLAYREWGAAHQGLKPLWASFAAQVVGAKSEQTEWPWAFPVCVKTANRDARPLLFSNRKCGRWWKEHRFLEDQLASRGVIKSARPTYFSYQQNWSDGCIRVAESQMGEGHSGGSVKKGDRWSVWSLGCHSGCWVTSRGMGQDNLEDGSGWAILCFVGLQYSLPKWECVVANWSGKQRFWWGWNYLCGWQKNGDVSQRTIYWREDDLNSRHACSLCMVANEDYRHLFVNCTTWT